MFLYGVTLDGLIGQGMQKKKTTCSSFLRALFSTRTALAVTSLLSPV